MRSDYASADKDYTDSLSLARQRDSARDLSTVEPERPGDAYRLRMYIPYPEADVVDALRNPLW